MTYFIRKVSSEQWEDELPENNETLEMAVDGITNCCRTSDNTLSVWRTSSRDPRSEENRKILIGMAMSRDRPAPFSFIFLSEEELVSLNLKLENSLGDTPYTEIASAHCDISELTLKKMGDLAWVIHEKVNDDAEITIVAEQEISEYTRCIFKTVEDLPHEKKIQKKWRGLYT